ncbi:uncharacterized protein LOC128735447 [Sabethes cyaneus]|uniref:uncharacterized protein LOC128735447 n=1 Tax=Sabethes cyaneus TaxID=53552 RepID=UPI00237E46FF|nr:uncharacterized protein LOC128735447 [Sabethes cyaneus]
MGSPLSPVIANLVMEKLEQHCIAELEKKNINLTTYRRYVDDCFCVATEEQINEILATFNSFHNRLQFTIEMEANKSIKFLDMMLTRNNELAFKPLDKIKHRVFSKLKDPIPPSKQKNVVYSIPCGTDDGKVYIGQTGRRLETRIAEHKNDAKKKEAISGLAQHTIQSGHMFDFDNTRILERVENQESRETAEMFHIKILGEEKTGNLQRECGTFNAMYNGLVTKLRQCEKSKQAMVTRRQRTQH